MTMFPNDTNDSELSSFNARIGRLRTFWFVLAAATVGFAFLAAVPVIVLLPAFAWIYSGIIGFAFALGILCLILYTRAETSAYTRWQTLRNTSSSQKR